MMIRRHLLVSIMMGWCLMYGPSAGAQQAPIPLKEVVITATKSELPSFGASAAVTTVITSEELERQGVSTILEAFRLVSGLDVVQNGGVGKATSVFLRGSNSDHTLVLVDGTPVNSPTLGSFDYADMLVDSIDRIEIVRGPQSTLYGSDAVGGVIQIFTKRAQTSQGSATVEGGSFGTSREAMDMTVAKGGYEMGLNAARLDTSGISAFTLGTEKDGYQNTSLSFRMGKRRTDGRTDLMARLVESSTELDGCKYDASFAPYDCDNPSFEQERRLTLVGLRYTLKPQSNWEEILSTSVTTELLMTRDPDPLGINSRIDTAIRRVEWQHNLVQGESNLLTVGYEWKEEEGDVRGSYSKALTNHGFYLQDHRGIGTPLEVLAGVRWDGNSQYEEAWTYRVLAAATGPDGTRAHVQYGTSFHGPDLNDLFWPMAGNTDLRPEKSIGWEAGLHRTSGPTSLQVTYFHNQFSNLIQWAPDPSDPTGFQWIPQNVVEAISAGWESELIWQPASGFRLSGNFTHDDTFDKENGGYLVHRPLNKYSFGLETGGPRKSMGISLLHVGRRFDKPANVDPLAAYNRVDFHAAYRMSERMEATFRIENILDKDYEEAKGYGVPGLSTYGGVRMTF